MVVFRRLKIIFLILLATFLIIFLVSYLGTKKEVHRKTLAGCGNGICEIGENSENCCIDCGCYKDNEVCEKNICIYREIKLTDLEFKKIVEEYFRRKNEKVLEIGEIANISLGNILGKTSIVKTSKSIYGVTIAENKTLYLYDCCHPGAELLDVWIKRD